MEIYAEISSKLAKDINDGYVIPIPNGVEVKKMGSRAYIFNCDDYNKDDLKDILDEHGISWQDDRTEDDVKKDIKIAKKEIKEKRKIIRNFMNELTGGY